MRRFISGTSTAALLASIQQRGASDDAGTKDGTQYFEKDAPKIRFPTSEPSGSADSVKHPEFETAFGKFETRPPGTGHLGTMRYENFSRKIPDVTIPDKGNRPMSPVSENHHPFYDYTSDTGHKENYNTKMAGSHFHWDIKIATHSLYRACLKGLPLLKQYYFMLLPLETMKVRVRQKFEQNRYIRDPDAVRHLLHLGWIDYTETICFRKTKNGVLKHFGDREDIATLAAIYTDEEGKKIEERATWNGEEQKREGPFKGYWSKAGQQNAEEFEKLAGRIPMSWSASKGYFEVWKADGTNFWEKNLDYEGWFVKNVDPDRKAARKEIQSWVEAGYNQPKHYASKNRRAYRRMVKDVEDMMTKTSHELYAESREQMFQSWIREWCPESNRIYAEKKLARSDDNVFTMKYDEIDACLKQCCREFPNPRLWKTDAFFLRMRVLTAGLEYNWAKAPIGVALEREWNQWISADVNHTVATSNVFDKIKKDKTRNPMAKTWTDFYTEFDPDVPSTRQLPWYHKDFDYDRRHYWDERCMRMKKWVQTGDVDFTNAFFDSFVFEWEQMVNRPEISKKPEAVEYRYTAPRMVQLYRALNKRMDVAMTNQLVEFMMAQKTLLPVKGGVETHGDEARVVAVKAALEKTDFSDFIFDVPAVIFPDQMDQPMLSFDGRPESIKVQV